MKKASYLFVCYLLFSGLSALAQGEHFRFDYLTTRNGLSQNHVNCIYQDQDGYIWIGTYNGLNRYDGYKIKTFQSTDEEYSLSQDAVNVIFQDSNGYLWIGTDRGLNKFDPATEQITNYYNFNPDSTLHVENNIRTIFEDDEGLLWIGFYGGGLKLFNHDNSRFFNPKELFGEEILPGHVKVNAFYSDNIGNYWIGTEYFGLIQYNSETGEKIQHLPTGEEGAINDRLITSIAEDRQGRLWIGTWNGGVNIYDHDTQSFKTFIPSEGGDFFRGPVTSIFMANEMVWFGTLGNGVFRYDLKNEKIINLNSDAGTIHGLNNNIVWDVFQDKSGVVWLGTYGGGVNLFYPGSGFFNAFRAEPDKEEGLKSSYVSEVLEVSEDSLLVGTLGGGMRLWNREYNNFSSDFRETELLVGNIRCLFKDIDSRIWVSTDNGLYRFNEKMNSEIFFPYNSDSDGIGNKSVYSIFQDSRGDLWFGLWGAGIRKLEYEESLKNDTDDIQFKAYQNAGFVGNTVWDFHEDTNGRLWIGAGNGLFRYIPAGDNFVYQPFQETEERTAVSCFYEDEINDRLIMGTLGKGVAFFSLDDFSVNFLNEEDGMLKNEVLSIHSDSERNLWICTSNGLSRFDTRNRQFRHLNVEMGMQENELLNKSWLLDTEEILVAGNNGFYTFNPANLIDSPFEPNIVITDFMVNNRTESVNLSRDEENHNLKVNLKPGQNTFSIEFAALDYRMSDKIEYQYMLEGFDEEWNLAHAGNRRATYTNMGGGDYVFKVKASNSDGLWTGREKSLLISLKAPFYRRTVFQVFFTILLIAVFYGLFLLREKKIKTNIKRRNELVAHGLLQEERNKLETQRNDLEKKLDEKEREFSAVKVYLKDKEERLLTVRGQIYSALENAKPEVRKSITQLLGRMKKEADDENAQQEYLQNLNIIHDGFIDRLAAKFPKLTQKDLIVCSYIKMGRSNKEIANQLSISTHSVEMSRYRTRKKMQLDSSVTLNDFLIRF